MERFNEIAYIANITDEIAKNISEFERLEEFKKKGGVVLDGNSFINLITGGKMRIGKHEKTEFSEEDEKYISSTLKKELNLSQSNLKGMDLKPVVKSEDKSNVCSLSLREDKRCSGRFIKEDTVYGIKDYCKFSSGQPYQRTEHWEICPCPGRQRFDDDKFTRAWEEFQNTLTDTTPQEEAKEIFIKILKEYFPDNE